MDQNHYDVLGVHPSAPQDAILKAYRGAVRRCHPDLHPDDPDARQKFLRVQGAFEVLSDPEKRRIYNRSRVSFDPTRTRDRQPSGSERSRNPCPWTGRFWPWGWDYGAGSYESLARHAVRQLADPVTGLATFTALGFSLHFLAIFCDQRSFGHPSFHLPVLFTGSVGFLMSLLSCLLALVVIAGAVQMRHLQCYRLAVTASIIAMLSCVSPWFLPAVPFGIWSLVVLRNEQVQDAFWS